MFEINIDGLNKDELKKMIKNCDQLKFKLSKRLLSLSEDNFDEKFNNWVEYGNKDCFLLFDVHDDIQKIIKDNDADIGRGKVYTLEDVIDMLENEVECDEMTNKEFNRYRKLLMDENFGSATYDW